MRSLVTQIGALFPVANRTVKNKHSRLFFGAQLYSLSSLRSFGYSPIELPQNRTEVLVEAGRSQVDHGLDLTPAS